MRAAVRRAVAALQRVVGGMAVAAAAAAVAAVARDCAAAAAARDCAVALDDEEAVAAPGAVFAAEVVLATGVERAALDAAADDETGGASETATGEAISVADREDAAASAHVRLANRVPKLP